MSDKLSNAIAVIGIDIGRTLSTSWGRTFAGRSSWLEVVAWPS